MIVLRNLDGTVGGFDPTNSHAASYVRVDEDLTMYEDFQEALARPSGPLPPMYRRRYERQRPRLYPDPRVGEPATGERVVFLYEETTRHVAPAQVPVRLEQVYTEIGRLHATGAELGAIAVRSPDAAVLSVARDAWLLGRLQDARTILLALHLLVWSVLAWRRSELARLSAQVANLQTALELHRGAALVVLDLVDAGVAPVEIRRRLVGS